MASDRGDIFRELMLRRSGQPGSNSVGSSVAAPKDHLPVQAKPARVQAAPHRVARIQVSDSELVEAIAAFFQEHVARMDWELVVRGALDQIRRNLGSYVKRSSARTLPDLIQDLLPSEKPADFTDASDFLNHAIKWLLTWVHALRSDARQVHEAIVGGYTMVLRIGKELPQ